MRAFSPPGYHSLQALRRGASRAEIAALTEVMAEPPSAIRGDNDLVPRRGCPDTSRAPLATCHGPAGRSCSTEPGPCRAGPAPSLPAATCTRPRVPVLHPAWHPRPRHLRLRAPEQEHAPLYVHREKTCQGRLKPQTVFMVRLFFSFIYPLFSLLARVVRV